MHATDKSKNGEGIKMMYVIKNSGKKERFDLEKVRNSISKAVIDAGLSADRMKNSIERVTKNVYAMAKSKATITTKEVRNRILSDFDKINKRVSNAWRKFEKKYQKIAQRKAVYAW